MCKGLVSILNFSLIFVVPLLNRYIFSVSYVLSFVFLGGAFPRGIFSTMHGGFQWRSDDDDDMVMMIMIIHFGNAYCKIMGGSEFVIF